jgi:cytochrome c553
MNSLRELAMKATILVCTAAAAVLTSSVYADEAQIQLKPGPGRDQVMGYCVMCHSLDYIQANSPFMPRQVWEAEVTKMIKAYGAQVPPEDVAKIVDYLTTNYGVATAAK